MILLSQHKKKLIRETQKKMSKANQNNTFIKIAVLINGIPDYKDTALTEKQIKQIQANVQQLNFDIELSHNYLSGITTKQSYISKVEEKIQGKTVPKGSWLMILEITNPTLLAGLKNNDIRGVSLETDFTDDIKVKGYTEVIPYRDVETKEEMIPSVISFTGSPANQFPLEIMTHRQYTMKSKQFTELYGGNSMTDVNEQYDVEERTWLRSLIDKLTTPQHTSKSAGVVEQPMNQPTMTGNSEELINSLIESQKSIPAMSKNFDAMVESNMKMTEAFNNMNSTLEQVLLKESAPNPSNPSPKKSKKEGEDDDEGDEGDNTQPNKEPNNPDNTDNNDNNNQTSDNTGLTPEEQETLKKLQEKQAKHTRKNIQNTPTTIKPTEFTAINPQQTSQEEYNQQAKTYMANRTFDYFMKGGQ